MSQDRWEKLKEFLLELLDLPESQWEDALLEHCQGDAELLAEARQILADYGKDDGFLRLDWNEPKRLEEFEILRILGRGAGSSVFEAYDHALDRWVALKVIPLPLMETASEEARSTQEPRVGARLDHESIATVFRSGADNQQRYFAMELVDGHSLADELKLQIAGKSEGLLLPPFSDPSYVRVVVEFMLEVASGLLHAHERGIVHRDIKPSNIMITRDGRPKIVDFGIAKDADTVTLTEDGTLMGTLPYMSPEQARKLEIEVDHRTDLYSWGITLYEALTLVRPFDGATTREVLAKIGNYDPGPRLSKEPRVPRALALLCAHAMARHPAHRHRTAAELVEDLEAYRNHRKLPHTRTDFAVGITRWARRHGWQALTAGAVVGALFLGFQFLGSVEPRARVPLSVVALDAAGRSLDGTAFYRWIDPLTSIPRERVELGELPVDTLLPDGFYRIVVEPEGASFREFSRALIDGESVQVIARVHPRQRDSEGMKLIDGARFQVELDPISISGLQGQDLDVASFWIDAAQVSIGEYRAYLEATGRDAPDPWQYLPDDGRVNELPAIYVTWEEAQAYAEWRGVRLVSHAEWVLAMRGPERRLYPNPSINEGNVTSLCNVNQRGQAEAVQGGMLPEDHIEVFLRNAQPVRSLPESRTPEGLYHALGNVWEWTEGPHVEWDSNALSAQPEMNQRTLLGGYWGSAYEYLCNLERLRRRPVGPNGDAENIGFRCARSVSP